MVGNNTIVIHESEEGKVIFGRSECWFYFINEEGHAGRIEMIRPGWFDLTEVETNAIKVWLTRNLKDGVLQG